MTFPIYDEISNNSLQEMHNGIQRALAEDDKNPSKEKVYGVRVFGDWKVHADAIEMVLTKRNVAFNKINW